MAAAEILTRTGGLPPQAFMLSAHDEFSSTLTSTHSDPGSLDAIGRQTSCHIFQFDGLLRNHQPARFKACLNCEYTGLICSCPEWADPCAVNLPKTDQFHQFEPPNLLYNEGTGFSSNNGIHPILESSTSPSSSSINLLNSISENENPLSLPADELMKDHEFDWGAQTISGSENLSDIAMGSKAVPAEKKAGRRRFVMPKVAKATLEESFRLEPYPDALEKSSIARAASMSVKQVKTWFSNKRSRNQPSQGTGNSTATEKRTNSSEPRLTRESLESLRSKTIDSDSSGVLENYLESSGITAHSTDDEQPPAAEPIANQRSAYAIPALPWAWNGKLRAYHPSTSKEKNDERIRESLIGVELNWRSSRSTAGSVAGSAAGSASSVGTVHSRASVGSMHSRGSRKGRRQFGTRVSKHRRKSAECQPKPSADLFNCTFCDKESFQSRYTWKRHEESVHVPRTTWICNAPYGIPLQDYQSTQPLCSQKPESERIFYRKDGLAQHLSTAHKVTDIDLIKATVEQWERKEPPLKPGSSFLICPFCQIESPTWDERANHVALHFKGLKEARTINP